VTASAQSSPLRRARRGLLPTLRGDAVRLVGGAFLVSWVAAVAWWWLLPASKTVELTIAAGTAALVRSGEVPPDVPRELVLRAGDTLAVRNLDSVMHRVGPLWVAPDALERSAVGPAFFAGADLTCTIHPAGALSVLPRSRPGLASTIPVALLAALPLGCATLFGRSIASRLDVAGGPGPDS
jgi:hypothetical protein